MKIFKSPILPVIVAALLLISAALGVFSFGGISIPVSGSASESATVNVQVVDGKTLTPLEGARVVIIETGEEYFTAKDGYTGVITVPVIRDSRFDKAVAQPWGEINMIIFMDGYLPYALFHAMVFPGQLRQGPQILLFTEKDAPSAMPFTIVEAPHKQWVNALIEKYSKD
ncbi:MAG: hypothetical protein ACOYJD_02485 [Christensenellales bacterium]|jgi:hypothetical protein